MSAPDPQALGARAEAMLTELGAISAEPGRLVRLFLTPEHRRAADLVAQWMREAGMTVSEDALGTVRGPLRRCAAAAADRLAHRHRDRRRQVRRAARRGRRHPGGRAFRERGRRLPFGIDVLAFGDEEGSRFPSTLASSSACAGVFERATLALADATASPSPTRSRPMARTRAEYPAAAYQPGEDVAAYVEVHIEQGPVLEAKDRPLGVVTGIVGQSRLRVTVTGEAGHAGTVPMGLRHDALAGAAEMALALETIAREHPEDGMVGTVGRIEALPGAVNIIPGTRRRSPSICAR